MEPMTEFDPERTVVLDSQPQRPSCHVRQRSNALVDEHDSLTRCGYLTCHGKDFNPRGYFFGASAGSTQSTLVGPVPVI